MVFRKFFLPNLFKIFLILNILMFNGCLFGKYFKSSGTYQSAIANSSKKNLLFFGKIENRDSRYTPFLVENFKDMLQTQIIESGIQIFDIIHVDEPKKEEPVVSVDGENKPISLSEGLNAILLKSAISNSHDIEKNRRNGILNSEEIRALAAVHQFNYFLQGAVGNNNSGTLLQEDENSLVFAKLYNADGQLIGVVNYSVSGRTLAEANLLREVCKKIADRLTEIIEKKK
ncbi:hypothetical protein LPTSP3_g07560 [Leptospira kobayashii]|uniref:Lipoprotein n=1 Tax=Leptospira kobayashii TaxID=1917830 RepID=A0ABM7UGZ7_9LEPT|nr:lipoprotein [Leptospira kobayashii]BDA77826.1 hypothetical protein LPTSP3_g07560 [Leptospira kobayashii]